MHIQIYTDKVHIIYQNKHFVTLHWNFKHQGQFQMATTFLYIYSFCVEDRTFMVVFSILMQYFRYHIDVYRVHANLAYLYPLPLDMNIIWDEVPTMVEIAIFWFQIHITNGLNSLHRKWHTGNQYRDNYAENRMHSNLELLPAMNVKKWLKIAVCSSPLNIYHGTDNIIKQSFTSSSSCPK